MAGEKVLLIDDEKEFVTALSERMETRGIKARTAFNGEEALSIARKEKFDAVVLDMVMPGMDGIETLKQLLKMNPDLQVILLTGFGTVQKSVEAMKIGALDFMEKPAQIQQLVEKIKEASANRIAIVTEKNEKLITDILKTKGW